MRDYSRYTCIKWTPRTDQQNYISIFSGGGCWSYVGCQNEGVQRLSLERPSASGTCIVEGIAQHEMMHASGFYHEQSRTDRDNYISIQWNNIVSGKEHNFQKYSTNQVTMMGVRYDYSSIMHYGNESFSRNDTIPLYTILTKTPGSIIGQRKGFSPTDQLKLNKYYNCKIPYNIPQPMDKFASPSSCSLDNNWCGWSQDYKVALDGSTDKYAATDDNFDWTLNMGSTPSKNTGPLADHTSGQGRYLFLEASSPRTPGDVARIRTPLFQGDGPVCISFWRLLWLRNGAQSSSASQWLQGLIQYRTNKQFQTLFEGIVGSSYQGDIGIDDFFVYKGVCGSVTPVLGPPSDCTFEAGTCGWTSQRGALFSWARVNNAYGPPSNDGGSSYWATRAAFPVFYGAISRSNSPPVTVDGNSACISFNAATRLTDNAALKLYIQIDGSTIPLWQSSSTQIGNFSVTATVQPKVPFTMVFEAKRGQGPLSDSFGVDDIVVRNHNC